jgi:exopolysaccharide production protein ExoZ
MIYSIQYLRALASILGVCAHTLGYWGNQGVDIFFVISGYIMMYLIANTHRTAGIFFLARYLRIAPLYYLLTGVAIIAGCAFEPTIRHIIQSVLFIKYQWSAPVLTVGWTLDYEFVFYSLCALALLISKNVKRVAILVSAAIFIGTILLDFVLFPEKKYGHFMEFWYGMVIYFGIQQMVSIGEGQSPFLKHLTKPKVLCCLTIIAFLISSLSVFLVDQNGKAYLRFLTFGLPAALLVFCSILYEKVLGIKEIKFLTLLGAASYSLYLSHEITLSLYYRLVGLASVSNLAIDLVGILIAILVGLGLYRFIEVPMINKAHGLIKALSMNR